ncbi:MAG: DUF3488 domain-containing protein [Microbacterium sp.]
MSRADTIDSAGAGGAWHREDEPEQMFFPAAVLVTASALVALWPYASVITPGFWSSAVFALVVALTVVGFGVRMLLRQRAVWIREFGALVAQACAAIGLLTLIVAGDTALFGVVPTSASMRIFGALTASAWEQVVFGSAPLESSPGLRLLLGAGFAILTILLGQLIAARGAVLASLLIGAVGALPMIATRSGANVAWFVALAVLVLVLFRSTARRHPHSPGRSSAFTAVAVGAGAVVVTLAIAPVIPVSASLAGGGVGVTVDASLRLGDDLREKNPVEVLTIATRAPAAPYLRLTTLSRFDGRVWKPDRGSTQATSDGFGDEEWGEEIAATEQSTSIRVLNLGESRSVVSFPAAGFRRRRR